MSSFDATGVLSVLRESPFHELVSRFTAFSVMVTDANSRVVWVNSSFETLSGWPLAEVIGRTPMEFLHGPETNPETTHEILEKASLGQNIQAEIVNYRRDGSLYWVSIDAQPIMAENGELAGYFSIQTDVTSRKRTEQQLDREHRLIKALSEARSQFIASDSARAVFEQLLQQLQSLTESPYGFIGEVCREADQTPWLRIHAITDISWDEWSRRLYQNIHNEGLEFRALDNLIGVSLRTGAPVISNQVDLSQQQMRLPPGHPPLYCYAGLPIYYRGRFLAVAGIGNRTEGYDEELLRFISPLLETIGELIDARNRDLQRRAVEQHLKQTEAWLEETGRVAGVGGWQFNTETNELRWTTQTRRLHRVSESYVPTIEDAIQFYDEPGRSLIRAAVNNAILEGIGWDLELPLTSSDGQKLWVRSKGQAAYEDGRVVRLFGTFQDITERIQAEHRAAAQRRILEMIANRARLPQILEQLCAVVDSQIPSAGSGFILVDDSGRVRLPGEPGTDCFRESSDFREESLTGYVLPIPELFRQHRGWLVLTTLEGAPECPRQQQLLAECCALAAIAINRFLEDEHLRRSETTLKDAVRRARLGYWMLNALTGRLAWSDGVFEILGRDPSFLPDLETFFCEILHPDDVEGLRDEQMRAFQNPGVVHEMDVRCILPDGSIRWVALEGTGEVDPEGHPVRMRGTIQDITERKRESDERSKLQSQLLQAQKMESIGRLAGGVAHDFNNMLAVILGHAEVAVFEPSLPKNVYESLKAIQHAGQRSAELTRQLLAFARRQAVTPQKTDLNQAINSMLLMLQRLIGVNIELVWNPGTNLWPVFVDPVQIDQILANLLVNARDAISGSGRIEISTQNEWLTDVSNAETESADAYPCVSLKVSDTGHGIEPELLSQIFEPFFTTKDIGKGTGLGLATVFGIVEQNRGFLRVSSQPGKGTSFQVCLPRFSDTAVSHTLPAAEEPIREFTGCILLVDDEPEILRIGRIHLQQLGHSVFVASHPFEALRIFSSHSDAITAVVTDVVMPLMSGWEMAASMRRSRPNLRCVFMSGYGDDLSGCPSEDSSDVTFLNKPFEITQLAAAIRRAFGKNASPANSVTAPRLLPSGEQ
ncbi:MAG: PAS domain S-box protein [Planctomyces sp.]|nr:PAS domain S-box protein [Planctomyces sp.]